MFLLADTAEKNEEERVCSKIHLVDLAGSERWNAMPQSSNSMESRRISELAAINTSLSALTSMVTSLADGQRTHIPYRYKGGIIVQE